MKLPTLLALSGGVDSSVAGYLLKQQNIEFEAVYLKNWVPRSKAEGLWQCQQQTDEATARAVASSLGVNLTCLNLEAEYRSHVIDYLYSEYEANRTPNPDILCNSFIKFGALYDYAVKHGFGSIATGHYAQVFKDKDYFITKATDLNKDQSYFLARLNQRQISFLNFPLANLSKPEVRQIAKDANLLSYDKKDSTGICFIGEQAIKPFLQIRLKPKPGPIVDKAGKVLGQHDGFYYYTIGQRHGLGLTGGSKTYYLIAKDKVTNTLIVSSDPKDLEANLILATDHTWTTGQNPVFPLKCKACLRYSSPEVDCQVSLVNNELEVELNTVTRAATPGQFIVFYQEQRIIGSAVIKQAKNI